MYSVMEITYSYSIDYTYSSIICANILQCMFIILQKKNNVSVLTVQVMIN